MKKLLVTALAAIAAFSSFACLPACKKDSYDVSYTSWNLGTKTQNNVERQMIKAFEQKYNVKVRIEENISVSGYDDSLNALIIRNNTPDVFMISNMNYVLKGGYAANIAEYAKNDADWAAIPAGVEDATHFKNGIYAVPFAMHMAGYFVNVDLLKTYQLEENIEGEFTWQKFKNIVEGFESARASGDIGLNEEQDLLHWYPSSQNENLGWFTWDGSQYHLDSQEFKDAIANTKEFRTRKLTYDSLDETDRENYGMGSYTGYSQCWDQGHIALRFGRSYEAPDMLTQSKGEFEIKFLGVPGNRTPLIGDYITISKQCKNKDIAYKLAKWMSFDPEGIMKRIELVSEDNIPNTLPVTMNQTVIDAYFEKFGMITGLKEKYANLSKSIVEGVKVIPGYQASRWDAPTGLTVQTSGDPTPNAKLGQFLDACWLGYEDYSNVRATDCNKLANEYYAKAIKAYEGKYE